MSETRSESGLSGAATAEVIVGAFVRIERDGPAPVRNKPADIIWLADYRLERIRREVLRRAAEIGRR
ncbi:MAG: hypothetical protein R3D33_10255 [Hyphomicrobiaceae bacterium]